jgi:cysteine desulfurase
MDAIYLDHAATTPVREEVRAAMDPYLRDCFGNPSSPHRWGREAAAALAEARDEVAGLLGARFSEIHFTRGGTESDNLAVRGRAAALQADGVRPRVVTTAIEHKAVLDAARHCASLGEAEVAVLDVTPDGSLDEDRLDAALAKGPAVASLMWVNNETGLVLDLPALAERVRAAGATLHTDAVQAVGKIDVRVDRVPVDLLTITGHKIQGPKGTGALFVRAGTALAPLLCGGGQEHGLRAGTEDVAGAVGLATALRLAVEERESESRRLGALRAELERRLAGGIEGLRVHGAEGRRAPHVASVGVPGVEGQSLLISLDLEGVAASGGSACQSGSRGGSHVIRALYGDGEDPAPATLRLSLGATTTEGQVLRAAEITCAVVGRLRAGAPA